MYYEHEQRFIGDGLLRKLDFILRKPFILNNCINADAISVATIQAENFLVKNIKKFDHKKISFMSLGADPELFYFVNNPKDQIDDLFDLSYKKILITVGSINKRKGINKLIQAYSDANISDQSLFIILGDGEKKYVDQIKKNSTKLSTHNKKIIVINSVTKEKLKYYYSLADLGIWNKASISIIEGMATGLPLLIKNTKSVNHLINGKNGYGYNSLSDCKEKIEELFHDSEKLEKMRKNAFSHFNKNFNYHSLAKNLSDKYQSMVINV